MITSPDTTTVTHNQASIDAVSRTVTTEAGFRLRLPIGHVHFATKQPDGVHFDVIWRNAERLVQDGYNVVIRTPRGRLGFSFYRRCITKSMVHALARLKAFHHRHGDDHFAHRKDFGGPAHGDWARLRFWGLIEAKPRDPEHPIAHRGWWRLTGLGHCWLRGIETVPRAVAVFDGMEVGFVDAHDRITVADAEPTFDLAAALGGAR